MAFERISLNIIPDGEMPVFHVSQFDVGRPIIIDLYNGDDAYTPAAGVTFELHCRKVDDNIVTLDTYEVDGNTITFASTEQLCACSGDNLCEISILLDDLVMGTLNFILHVERDPLAGGCTSETSIYNLQQQIDDIITGEGYVKDTDLNILQSDWNEEDDTSPAYIKNKPSGTMQVQSDWTEADTTSPAYIKHKPEIPAAQVQSDWNESDNTKADFIKNKPDLSIYAQSSSLAAVATSGDYDDLTNKPTIPAAQVNSDWNSNSGVSQILNKPYVPVYTENETPYQIRTAPAGNNRTLEKLIGVSCAFNQLNQASNNKTRTVAGVTFTNNNDGSVSVSGTCDTSDYYSIANTMSTVSGHKIYVFGVTSTSNYFITSNGSPTSQAGSNGVIINSSGSTEINLFMRAGAVLDITVYPQVIDLTAMFGSEVADYLYTLESGTAGSGIALFRQLFPEDYYAYQTATLISSKPVSKVVVGINQWDEQWENGGISETDGSTFNNPNTIRSKNFIPCLPNTNYYYYCGSGDLAFRICYYDLNKVFISCETIVPINRIYQTPANCAFIKFGMRDTYGTTYNNDISINYPSTEHDYHAYESHTYPLGGDELRGLLKVENGQLVAYGDVKPSDGNGTEVFDIVDLGTLDWDYQGYNRFTPVQDIGAKIQSSTVVANIICDTYITVSQSEIAADKIIAGLNWGNGIIIHDTAYTDTTAFKTAMSGKYLIYEKATPTAKSYTPFTNPMLCGSTEEFTDSRSLKMFCGHDSLYYSSPFKGW